MKLCIPQVGDKLKLKKNWTFTVWSEYRNRRLGAILGLFDPEAAKGSYRVPHWKGQDKAWEPTEEGARYPALDCVASGTCTLPKGTVLTIDRIYIRKGASDFSSLSFLIHYSPELKFVKTDVPFVKNVRFWAKLNECNDIEFEPVEES